jgi:hypothetical protein
VVWQFCRLKTAKASFFCYIPAECNFFKLAANRGLHTGNCPLRSKSRYNLTIQRKFDGLMKKNFKNKYMNWKEGLACQRADRALQRREPA